MTERSAIVSPCGIYRYRLGRRWSNGGPVLVVVMLNPSTGDAAKDDATIRRLTGFCSRLGFGGFEICNLWAFRSRNPAKLKAAGHPVGPENDSHIRFLARNYAGPVLCAWGAHARGHERGRVLEVTRMFRARGCELFALDTTDDNIPRHPLMLTYDGAALKPWAL